MLDTRTADAFDTIFRPRASAPLAERSDDPLAEIRQRVTIEVQPDGTVVLTIPEGDLVLRAAQGRVSIEGAAGVHLSGPNVTVETPVLRQVVGVLETRAKRIVEKAHDSYREVEGTAQLKAKQVRFVAKQTFRALAERVRLRSSEDTKVQAKKIYLG